MSNKPRESREYVEDKHTANKEIVLPVGLVDLLNEHKVKTFEIA